MDVTAAAEMETSFFPSLELFEMIPEGWEILVERLCVTMASL